MARPIDRQRGLVERFRAGTEASTAPIFAMALVPLLAVGGMAFDYSRAATMQTRLQAALDAGALAAAASPELDDKQRADLARAAFARNFLSGATAELVAEPKVKVAKRKITMSVSVEYPTTFMRIVGIKTVDIASEVEVAIPKDKKAEIALVLDYSGSMAEVSGGKVKYVAMREAAVKLVDDLSNKGKSKKVKFGLVPFSHHVYATLPGNEVVGVAAKTWTGCTQDRKYPYNLSDDTPLAGIDDSKWGQPVAPVHADTGCDGYLPRNLVVRPVSDDVDGVKAQLEAMQPYAWTHIALGFEFGWHLLAPTQPFGGTAAYDDDTTMKVLVLLTDGRQTEPAFGSGKTRSVVQGEENLASLCTAAKAKGLTVITVAFDLEDVATRDRLRDCASDPGHDFFVAEDDDQLAAAFEKIQSAIKSAIYISK